jgi:hypothetical protein
VRCAGSRLRVSGQLVSAETGALIWADRFEGEMSDVLTCRIVSPKASLRRSSLVCGAPRSGGGPGRALGHQLVTYNRGLGPRTPTLQDARWNKPGRSG